MGGKSKEGRGKRKKFYFAKFQTIQLIDSSTYKLSKERGTNV